MGDFVSTAPEEWAASAARFTTADTVEPMGRICAGFSSPTNRGPMTVPPPNQVAVRVPSDRTARIQECHLLCIHILCAAVERDCV